MQPTHTTPSASSGVIRLPAPRAGETIVVPSIAGAQIAFAFDPASATAGRSGNDLTFSAENGEVTLKNFFAVGEDGLLPTLVLPDNTVIAAVELLKQLDPGLDVSTAAGPASASSGGAGEYADGAGSLLGGVERLGSLGTAQWNGSTEMRESPITPLAATTAAAGLPGLSAPPEPDPAQPFTLVKNLNAIMFIGDTGNDHAAGDLSPYTFTVDASYFGTLADNIPDGAVATGRYGTAVYDAATGKLTYTLFEGAVAQVRGGAQDPEVLSFAAQDSQGNSITQNLKVSFPSRDVGSEDADRPNFAFSNDRPADQAALFFRDAVGDEQIVVFGARNEVASFKMDGAVSLYGGSYTTGSGSDTVRLYAESDTRAYGMHVGAELNTGGGNDSIAVEVHNTKGESYVTTRTARGEAVGVEGWIRTGEGHDTVDVTVTNKNGFAFGVTNAFAPTAGIEGGAGNDSISISAHSDNDSAYGVSFSYFKTAWSDLPVIDGGSGDDTITVTATSDALWAMGLSKAEIHGGAGNDVITVTADSQKWGAVGLSNAEIHGGDGNDIITVSAKGGESDFGIALNSARIDAGTGDDAVNVTGIVKNSVIGGGTGSDTLTLTDAFTVESGTLRGFENVVLKNTALNLTLGDLLESEGLEVGGALFQHGMIVNGDAESSVNLSGGWTQAGTHTVNGTEYTLYTAEEQTVGLLIAAGLV